MPSQELKRTFLSGKMNRDIEERLVPQGQYRFAQNINLGRSESGDIGAVENVLGNVQIPNTNALTDGHTIGVIRDNANERIYYFTTSNDDAFERNTGNHAIFEYDQRAQTINELATGTWLNFHTSSLITGVNIVEGLLFFTDNRNEPRKIDVDRARINPLYYDSDDRASVIKYAPITAPTVTAVSLSGNDSTFMEERFIRLGYRFKFADGELSVVSPLTPILFNSISSIDAIPESGEIADFINNIKQVYLDIDVPTGFGITSVELIYNESRSQNLYVVTRQDVDTDTSNLTETVSFTYDSQDPFETLEPDQLTRVSDAVPRRAQAQEFGEGRIVYGNYLENYDIPELSFNVVPVTKYITAPTDGWELGTEYNDGDGIIEGENIYQANQTFSDGVSFAADLAAGRWNFIGPYNASFPRASIKSRRSYQVGIVLGDRYGRLSPVILSTGGNDSIYVGAQSAAEAAQQLQVQFTSNFDPTTDLPDWVYSYRVVVKQRDEEYYNVFITGAAGDDSDLPVIANNINKLPRDQTQPTEIIGDTAIAASNVKLYRKIEGETQNVSDDREQVSSMTLTAGEITANLPNEFTATSGVFETVPEESALDIFYETPTSGLIADITAQQTNNETRHIINVDFFNCYVLNVGSGNLHVEMNRIRGGFNERFFTRGLKAFAVNEDFDGEVRRLNALIHSSDIFNSRTGINNSNQFNIGAGGITLALDPQDGSIQKLYAEDTQLIIFQEDKISRSPLNKDFIYASEGGQVPVTSNSQFLGTVATYIGEYGISKNPESFAVYGRRKYFSDRNRGVVLRLSQDGLTEISRQGMSDFFRDALAPATRVVGSFDEYFNNYNLTAVGDETYTGNEDTNIATAADGYFTVSFDEEVGGWSSFKTFQQEFGATLNNRYYTFNAGHLYRHNDSNSDRHNLSGVYDRGDDLENAELVVEINDGTRATEIVTVDSDFSGTRKQMWEAIEAVFPIAGIQLDVNTSTREFSVIGFHGDGTDDIANRIFFTARDLAGLGRTLYTIEREDSALEVSSVTGARYTPSANYNRFYDVQYPSFLECIFNDFPSVVKEFKTLGYEGNAGWKCDHIITDIESFETDPDADQLENLVTLSVDTSGVDLTDDDDGITARVDILDPITAISGGSGSAQWVAIVRPVSDAFEFTAANNITTATFNGSAITGTLFEGNIYYLLDVDTLPSEDTPYNLVLEGEASLVDSGVRLGLNLINNLDASGIPGNLVVSTSTTANSRAVSGSRYQFFGSDSNDNLIVRFFITATALALETHEFADFTVTIDDNVYSVTGVDVDYSSVADYFGTNAVTAQIGSDILGGNATSLYISRSLNSLATEPNLLAEGNIVISGDGVTKRPVVTFGSPTLTDNNEDGDDDTLQFTLWIINDQGSLVAVPSEAIEYIGAAGGTENQTYYAIPEDGVNIAADTDVTLTITPTPGDTEVTLLDDDDALVSQHPTLEGAASIRIPSTTLVRGNSQTDTSNDISYTTTIDITLSEDA